MQDSPLSKAFIKQGYTRAKMLPRCSIFFCGLRTRTAMKMHLFPGLIISRGSYIRIQGAGNDKQLISGPRGNKATSKNLIFQGRRRESNMLIDSRFSVTFLTELLLFNKKMLYNTRREDPFPGRRLFLDEPAWPDHFDRSQPRTGYAPTTTIKPPD